MALIKKYWQIYMALFKASFIADLEYRANLVSQVVTDIFWVIAQITTFKVLFLHTPKIGDWNLAETQVFLGLLFIIDALYMIFIHENINNISEKVRKGDLDLLLTKPVSSQFMVSLQKANFALFGNLLVAIGWFVYAVVSLGTISPWRFLWLIFLIPASLVIIYFLRFSFAVFSLIIVRSENLQFLWWQIYKVGMRPDSSYVPWMRWVILTILPVGLVISVPARALLNPPDIILLLWPIVLMPILLYLSHRFWQFGLKYYSSASS